jgi:hypothetical protein
MMDLGEICNKWLVWVLFVSSTGGLNTHKSGLNAALLVFNPLLLLVAALGELCHHGLRLLVSGSESKTISCG